MHRSSSILLVLATAAGCRLDGPQSSHPDAGPSHDAPPNLDAGPTDAGTDAGTADARTADAMPSDAAAGAPEVVIHDPIANTVIADHADLRLDVTVTGDRIATIEIAVDGVRSTATTTLIPILPASGDCTAGCDLTIVWDADLVREGARVITVRAIDVAATVGTADVALRFEDTPTITFTRPTSSNQLGVGTLAVVAHVVDRGPIDGVLIVDGATLTTSASDCRLGCDLAWTWTTKTIPAGDHLLTAIANDGARAGTATTSVTLGDIAMVTAIEVTGIVDEFGRLETEVHLEDAQTGARLGCAGQDQGLEGVDYSDVPYTVTAGFVDPGGAPLGAAGLVGHTLQIRAIEDDDAPCPGGYSSLDDPIGLSSTFAGADLASAPHAFENVVSLTLGTGRPLVH